MKRRTIESQPKARALPLSLEGLLFIAFENKNEPINNLKNTITLYFLFLTLHSSKAIMFMMMRPPGR